MPALPLQQEMDKYKTLRLKLLKNHFASKASRKFLQV